MKYTGARPNRQRDTSPVSPAEERDPKLLVKRQLRVGGARFVVPVNQGNGGRDEARPSESWPAPGPPWLPPGPSDIMFADKPLRRDRVTR